MSPAEERELWNDADTLRRRREHVALIVGALLLFSAVGTLAYVIFKPQPVMDKVLFAAQRGVTVRLEVHGRLWFSPRETITTIPLSDQIYEVKGWVQDVSGNGRVQGYLYTAIVQKDPAGGWYADRVEISPLFLDLTNGTL